MNASVPEDKHRADAIAAIALAMPDRDTRSVLAALAQAYDAGYRDCEIDYHEDTEDSEEAEDIEGEAA